jgi:hypothetical protein
VRDEEHGRRLAEVLHPPEAAPLELASPTAGTSSEENLGSGRGDSKRQPTYPAGITLTGVSMKRSSGEIDDLVELPRDLSVFIEHRAIEDTFSRPVSSGESRYRPR